MNQLDIPEMGVPYELMERLSIAEQHEYLQKKFGRSRSGVNRRDFLRFSGVAAVAATALAPGMSQKFAAPSLLASDTGAADASVKPMGRHLAWGNDPQTSVAIAWQTGKAVKNPYLRFGASVKDLGAKVKAELRNLHTGITPGATTSYRAVDQYYLHALLTRLIPGTTYYYVVGSDEYDPIARGDAPIPFQTAPASTQPFTFTAFGDQGTTADAAANVKAIAAIKPAFHLHAGDICYANPSGGGVVGDQYDATNWDRFFVQNEPVAQSAPWMVATGNHDLEAYYSVNGYGGHQARFDFPTTGFDPSNAPSVYSFSYSNVAVLCLDSNDNSWEITGNNGYTAGKQLAWLEAELKKYRAQPGIDFIITYHHYCAYSTTNQHASDGHVRDTFGKLYDKYQVDLVIQGHNHVYERTDTLRANQVVKPLEIGGTTNPVTDGIVYVTAGSAGKSLYSFPAPDTYAGAIKEHQQVDSYFWSAPRAKTKETIDWSRVRFTGFAFLRIDATPRPSANLDSKLHVRALMPNGTLVDEFTVVKAKA
ncbi:purple acid phosphatase family protein [Psychromicrobium sp. YIM B11713]|uniref:purple acid phosphatase family protein n=1 Tax=Psychromicrobium sp. YIM B11713 TaxID=3145233 RepID=UPI00374E234A